ncbi:MAG: hypothetical protein ACRDRO_06660 [Pseudonocardiaceae bacterium]
MLYVEAVAGCELVSGVAAAAGCALVADPAEPVFGVVVGAGWFVEPGALPAAPGVVSDGLADVAATCPAAGWPPVGWTFDAVPEAGLAEPDPVPAAPKVLPDGLAEDATPCPAAGWPPVMWACDPAPVEPFVPPVSEAGSPLLLAI